ncbi:MAG: DUF559 domain-containing protein [Chloroflexota bacterium]
MGANLLIVNFRQLIVEDLKQLRANSYYPPEPIVAYGITPQKHKIICQTVDEYLTNWNHRLALSYVNPRDLYESQRQLVYHDFDSPAYEELTEIIDAELDGFHAPYTVVYDSTYASREIIPGHSLLSVFSRLVPQMSWGIICFEPNEEYWLQEVPHEFRRLFERNFKKYDFAKGLSPIENRLKEALDDQEIPYQSQYPVHNEDAGFTYRLDFYIEANGIQLDVECDGEKFHTSESAIQHDRVRDSFMRAKGIQVLRFTGKQIHDEIDWCIREIRRTVRLYR